MSILQRLPGTLTQKIDGILFFFLAVAVALIGTALWVGHQLEGGAGAINEAGLQRMRTYRIAYLLEQAGNTPERRSRLLAEVEQALAEYEAALALLSRGDPQRPLLLPATGPVREQLERVQRAWTTEMAPRFRATVALLETPFPELQQVRAQLLECDETVRRYVPEVHKLVAQIESWNAHHTSILWWLLNGFLVASFLSTVFLLLFFRHLVSRPLSALHRGIERMGSADFAVRLPVDRRDEFGAVAQGFNRMADELKSLYATLEERVEEKTRALEARAQELAILYEVAATTAEPEEVDKLVRAVLARTASLVGAQGWMVRFNRPRDRVLTLIASEGMAQGSEQAACATSINWEECLCGQAVAQNHTLVGCPTQPMADGNLPFCLRHRYHVVAIPMRVKQRVIGLFNLLFDQERRLEPHETRLLETIGHHLAVAIENLLLAEREKEMAVSEERNLLAQELHDSIAQTLAYLNLQAQMLAQSLAEENLDQARQDLALIREGIQESYDTVRELLVSFRIRVEHHDLCEALTAAAERFEGQTAIRTRLYCHGVIGHLSPSTILQVLHIVQEALSNVRKHAHADEVTIHCTGEPHTLTLTIADNGVGFDAQQLPLPENDHVGLQIMRERAHRIGATLTIESSPGVGTTITLTLPRTQRVATDDRETPSLAHSARG
ncbi:type IV pili methyl-accepting chemotaxis transducer N-terminal domain-containing protein [Hydrogenophilus islandicus]